MYTIEHTVAGDTVSIHVVTTPDDLHEVHAFIDNNPGILCLDTETTGLKIYGDDFRIRVVQIGNATTAYTIPVDAGRPYQLAVKGILAQDREWTMHNMDYDTRALDRVGLASFEWLTARTYDTMILAHLIDSRGEREGGIGHSLKPLSAVFVDPSAEDTQGDLKAIFKAEGLSTGDGFAKIDLNNHTYQLYAGLDVIYGYRLFARLSSLIRELDLSNLAKFEHRVASICSRMSHRGVRVDIDYTRNLVAELHDEAAKYEAIAATFGVVNVNAPKQVAEALIGMGETLTERTASGNVAVGKEVLLPLADLAPTWDRLNVREPNPLADAVLRAKRARKWAASYGEAILHDVDSDGRIHPTIKSLGARTGRMSVSGPPLQQLPSSGWSIRRCLIPEPGYRFATADYAAVELRTVAALANIRRMREAIDAGEDLHDTTAALVYGHDFTKAQRKIAKGINFGTVYGGGATGIAKLTGAPADEVGAAVKRFHDAYPEIKAYGRRLQAGATARGYVATPTGRRLHLDRDRGYAAINYCLAPGTRILTSDLRHVPIETLSVGDTLVGFDEHRPVGARGNVYRRFRKSTVEAISTVVKPSLAVTVADGTTSVCSEDHLWLIRRPNANIRFQWVKASDLREGDIMLSVGQWETCTSRTAGYLSGLYDGEGSMSGRAGGKANTALMFSQKPGLVMPRVEEIYDGAAIVGGKQLTQLPVVSIEPVGNVELVSVQTSTRTLIANGLLSHNCVQSTARDILASALLRIEDAGMIDAVSLVVHDEVIMQAPDEYIRDVQTAIRDLMGTNIDGVPIVADADPTEEGSSWGACGYGAPARDIAQ